MRQELAETRDRLEVERSDAEKLRRRLAEEEEALAEERRSVSGRMKGELEQFRRDTTERLRREEARLRERFEEGRRKGLAAEAVESLFAAAPAFAPPEPAPSGPLVVGGPVRHLGLGWQGVLEKLEDGRADVLVRGKRLRARPEELAPAGPPQAPKKERGAPLQPAALRGREGDMAEPVEREINLIGLRVEPALEQLDAYLDQALLSSRQEVRVIHGHGSGRLREAVRQHLRSHRGVAEIRSGAPNEGGNGATVVIFRSA